MMRKVLFLLTTAWSFIIPLQSIQAQQPVSISDSVDQHIFSFGEIEYLEDAGSLLRIEDIADPSSNLKFQPSATFSPENYNRESAYWYRIKIGHDPTSARQWILEFFDQTIDRIEFFAPDEKGDFHAQVYGDSFLFGERSLKHKNFVVRLANETDEAVAYYFKIESKQQADILVVLRSSSFFFEYAIDEYFFFGIFYGMILVFSFYNLLMYAAVRESHYLYYIIYLVSIGLYEMSADGIAYQYLWPTFPVWNQYAAGVALYLASTALLIFTSSLLNLHRQHPVLFRILAGAFLFRTVFLVLSLTVFESWFAFRFIEIIPFSAAFYTAIRCLFFKGYRPARFLVAGYSILAFGVFAKLFQYFDINFQPFGGLTHYSLGFSFILQMLFLSFAISDKIRVLRLEKEKAQQLTIEQLRENQKLKDTLNRELEEQVKIKTKEVVEKSEHIRGQNVRLEKANEQLLRQAREIAAMNALLARDNIQLKHDVEVVTEARIFSKEVDFEEFSATYPDSNSCFKFLAERKWQNGYHCRKCTHVSFSDGKSPHSRRCTRCGYEESVTAYTLLQNTRLSINKAFYMIFLIYSSKGNISSHKLSEILNIRQSTCWLYSSKIKKAMKERRKGMPLNHQEGWDALLLNEEVAA